MFNAKRTIRRALASVLAQSVPPAEVIVVDDGSSDDGLAIVAAEFPDVRLVRQSNGGPGSARNHGVRLATHAWTAFLDADDSWDPDHLEEFGRLISEFPGVGLVATAYREVSQSGRQKSHRWARRSNRREIDYFRVAARSIGVVWSSAAAASTEALRATGGFSDDPAGEDLVCWARLALDERVSISSRITASYIRRPDSQMATLSARDSATRTTSAADILSPSMRVVAAALEAGTYADKQASLVRYLDGRLASRWKRILLFGDQDHAQACVAQLRRPYALTNWPLRAVALTSPFLLNLLSALRVRGMTKASRR